MQKEQILWPAAILPSGHLRPVAQGAQIDF